MAHKIQDELDQVERQVYILEKEENELRRVRKKIVNQWKRSVYNFLSNYIPLSPLIVRYVSYSFLFLCQYCNFKM